MVLFSYTNGAYEFCFWVLCGWSFQVLGKDSMDYGIRSGKSLRLGIPRMASPLSSSSIGNFTWSYIFIRHMICVLLGASFYFASFCLLLVRIMFCIFSFNKKVKDSLCHAYFACMHVAVWKQKAYRCCKNSQEKSDHGLTLNNFAYWDMINLLQWEF